MPYIPTNAYDALLWLCDHHYDGVKMHMASANHENLKTLMMETYGMPFTQYAAVLFELKAEWDSIRITGEGYTNSNGVVVSPEETEQEGQCFDRFIAGIESNMTYEELCEMDTYLDAEGEYDPEADSDDESDSDDPSSEASTIIAQPESIVFRTDADEFIPAVRQAQPATGAVATQVISPPPASSFITPDRLIRRLESPPAIERPQRMPEDLMEPDMASQFELDLEDYPEWGGEEVPRVRRRLNFGGEIEEGEIVEDNQFSFDDMVQATQDFERNRTE